MIEKPTYNHAFVIIAASLVSGLLSPSAGCFVDTTPVAPTAWSADGSPDQRQRESEAWESLGNGSGYGDYAGSNERFPSTDGDPRVRNGEDDVFGTDSDSGTNSGTSDSDGSSSETPTGFSDAGADVNSLPRPPAVDNEYNSDKEDKDVSSDNTGCVDRPLVIGCDPTVPGGCPDLMQCVIDPLATTAAGVCIFSTPMGEEICFSSPMTESCPPTFVCFYGICQELCLCDEDCSTGRCCGDPVGTQGFKLCAEC